MGKLKYARRVEDASSDEDAAKKRRKGRSDTPSANALRERVRAQNMKQAYLNLQKTLPQVPPDTKLPRLNILLLAIDYISYLRRVLQSETFDRSFDSRKKSCMLKPFIEVRIEVNRI